MEEGQEKQLLEWFESAVKKGHSRDILKKALIKKYGDSFTKEFIGKYYLDETEEVNLLELEKEAIKMKEEKQKEPLKFILSEEEASIVVSNLAQNEDYQQFLKISNGSNIAKIINDIRQVAEKDIKPVKQEELEEQAEQEEPEEQEQELEDVPQQPYKKPIGRPRIQPQQQQRQQYAQPPKKPQASPFPQDDEPEDSY